MVLDTYTIILQVTQKLYIVYVSSLFWNNNKFFSTALWYTILDIAYNKTLLLPYLANLLGFHNQD